MDFDCLFDEPLRPQPAAGKEPGRPRVDVDAPLFLPYLGEDVDIDVSLPYVEPLAEIEDLAVPDPPPAPPPSKEFVLFRHKLPKEPKAPKKAPKAPKKAPALAKAPKELKELKKNKKKKQSPLQKLIWQLNRQPKDRRVWNSEFRITAGGSFKYSDAYKFEGP